MTGMLKLQQSHRQETFPNYYPGLTERQINLKFYWNYIPVVVLWNQRSNSKEGNKVSDNPYPAKVYPNDRENTYATYAERAHSQNNTCRLETNDIIHAFNGFYGFFHLWSKIISIATFIGWLFYLMFGYTDNLSQQNTAIESFARNGTQNLQVSSFNPHLEVLVFAILILIFGLFLSYISAAISKYFELRG
jgi:hypothetical protein